MLRLKERQMRRFLIRSSRVLAIVLGVALLGAAYESVSEAADARAYPPAGQMVDMGGYRLHINCVGAGSPAVVIESGLGEVAAARRPPGPVRPGWAFLGRLYRAGVCRWLPNMITAKAPAESAWLADVH